MKLKLALWTSSACLLLTLACPAETPVTSAISYDASNPTNQVLLTWEAIPSKQYRILTTTALGQPWQTLTNTPLAASNNLVKFPTRADATARFFKVAKLDTEPPAIWRMTPSSNGIAVPRQSQLTIFLSEETGLDTNSIALTVGTNPPVTLADSRLRLAGNVLTYTPATNQFLGTNGQTITNKLIISDTLGYRATNAWPFKLELTPILASNVVIISPGSPLTLVSTNGDTYAFSYTNTSSGLTNGAILVSTDPNFAYKRRILSLTDDPGAHSVSLVTTQAALAEILMQGSVRFYATDFVPEPLTGPHPLGPGGITVALGGQTLFSNATMKVETTAGRLTFDTDFSLSADVLASGSLDLTVSAEMAFDLTITATWNGTGNFAPDPKPIGKPLRKVRWLGWIPVPPPVFAIPVWAEAVWEFSIGTDGEVAGQAVATAGFESTRSVAFGAHMRNWQWTTEAADRPHAAPYPVTWQGGGAGRIRGFVEPKLTIRLDSLVGPTANLRPYLEVVGNACVQPGQAGIDASLYAGLNGTLALDVSFWKKDWPSLPSGELFNVRGLLWHKLLGGPPPTVAGNLVWIPCGTFTMGSPASEPARYSDEGPQTRVTISQGFWMGKHAVTQGEYLAVMGSNPSYFNGIGRGWDPSCSCYRNVDFGTELNRPVEQVSWNDAVAYCAALTSREQSAGRLPAGYVYRLPTEAEREYACRAGTTTPFHYGNELRSGMANFYGNYEYLVGDPNHYNAGGIYLGRTTSAGSYAPNAWGLYDMHGNVWEWCQDWYGAYSGVSVTDPQGPSTGSRKVKRGGGWGGDAARCRSARRGDGDGPPYLGKYVGFRAVLAPGQ